MHSQSSNYSSNCMFLVARHWQLISCTWQDIGPFLTSLLIPSLSSVVPQTAGGGSVVPVPVPQTIGWSRRAPCEVISDIPQKSHYIYIYVTLSLSLSLYIYIYMYMHPTAEGLHKVVRLDNNENMQNPCNFAIRQGTAISLPWSSPAEPKQP